jgi:hypothetical protein
MTKREEIARAIYATTKGNTHGNFDELGPEGKTIVLLMADVAIAAMREPTPEMREAGLHAGYPGAEIIYPDEFPGPEWQIDAIFTAMITAAEGRGE